MGMTRKWRLVDFLLIVYGFLFVVCQFQASTRLVDVRGLCRTIVLFQFLHHSGFHHLAGQVFLKPTDAVCQVGGIGWWCRGMSSSVP